MAEINAAASGESGMYHFGNSRNCDTPVLTITTVIGGFSVMCFKRVNEKKKPMC